MNTVQIFGVIVLSSAFMILLIWIRSTLLKIACKDLESEVYFVLAGIKSASELELVIRSMMWHRNWIGQTSSIIIVDDGLSPEVRRMAEIFAEGNDYIQIL